MAENLRQAERVGILRSATARARFMVLAATGKCPSELMRAQRAGVDFRRRVWNVRDGKGGWSPGVYLNDDMLAAWRVFCECEAWGTFRTGSYGRTLRAHGWPNGIRPYNLRHTIGITLSESGIDLADIQAHMSHKHIATTRQHYVPVLNSRLQRASEAIDGRLGWAETKAHKKRTAKKKGKTKP